MALKKKIQCSAISKPTNTNFNNERSGIWKDFFLKTINTARKKPAKSIRYQTKASAVIVIKAPKIAVKPQINTIK